MTTQEFLVMDADEQAWQLLYKGVFIGKVIINHKISVLFQLDSFYVKITYRTYRKEVEKIECYHDPGELSSYIEQVPIGEFELKRK